MKYASKILAQAVSWLGVREGGKAHKKIIDTYNGHRPLARGYKLKYTDNWCAGFVSAVAIACGYTDIIPTECGCQKMIERFKTMGRWVEADNHIPAPGDVLFYDWNDKGKGDCTGWADHVGYVEKVEGNTITIIEGNYSDCVKRRTMKIDGRYIRGYGVPKYDVEETAAAPEEKPEYFVYPVKQGESLWELAERFLGYGPRYKEIMELNGLTSSVIYVDQKLKIPEE